MGLTVPTWGKSNQSTCGVKTAYTVWRQAEKAAHRNNQFHRHGAKHLFYAPYKCRRCGRIHIGARGRDMRPTDEAARDPEAPDVLALRRVRRLRDVEDLG